MPCLRVFTNLPNSKIPKDFVNKVLPVLVKTVRKTPAEFTIMILGDCQLFFGGESSGPGAVASLESIGHVDPEDNKIIGRELSDFIEKELGVIPDRLFMTIYDMKGTHIVRGGITH